MNLRGPVLIVMIALALSACGGGEETAATGVASASDLDETIEDATELATETVADNAEGDNAAVTAEEAGLALAVCMRDSGFEDFPDPQIDANGNVNLRTAIADSGIDFQADGFRDQIAVCQDEVGADNFGAGARGEQREAIQEQLLGYTQCLRDEGLDVGDLGAPGGQQGGQNGQNGDGDGAGAGNGPGRAQGNVGNTEGRGARVAQALGLDAEDPATADALVACDDVLVEAFTGVGAGQPPAADDN